MPNAQGHNPDSYVIRVRGHLDESWVAAFSGMTLTLETVHGQATTLLEGPCDQAALHGILSRIRDMGLELLLVKQTSPP